MCCVGRIGSVQRASGSLPGGGGTAIPKRWGVPPEPHGERNREIDGHQERIIEQFI